MGFEPHSVRRIGSESCLPAPTEGVNPLVLSPRRGYTPFGTPVVAGSTQVSSSVNA
jgi:hypothetical protein